MTPAVYRPDGFTSRSVATWADLGLVSLLGASPTPSARLGSLFSSNHRLALVGHGHGASATPLDFATPVQSFGHGHGASATPLDFATPRYESLFSSNYSIGYGEQLFGHGHGASATPLGSATPRFASLFSSNFDRGPFAIPVVADPPPAAANPQILAAVRTPSLFSSVQPLQLNELLTTSAHGGRCVVDIVEC